MFLAVISWPTHKKILFYRSRFTSIHVNIPVIYMAKLNDWACDARHYQIHLILFMKSMFTYCLFPGLIFSQPSLKCELLLAADAQTLASRGFEKHLCVSELERRVWCVGVTLGNKVLLAVSLSTGVFTGLKSMNHLRQ